MTSAPNSLPAKVLGMSHADYLAQNDFDSRSFLCSVMRFGGAAQQWMDQGHSMFGGNNATRLGTKFDTAMMAIASGREVQYVVLTPPAEVLSTDGRRVGAKYKQWAAGLKPWQVECNEDEAFVLRTMIEHTLANPAAKSLVENTTETQLSVFGHINGHPIKVRPDGCTTELWWDLKSTSAQWDALYRSVMDYGYGEQEWLYREMAMQVGWNHFRMPFVFCQTMAPYACHVFYLPIDWVEEAGQRLLRVMEEVRLRRSTGEYLPIDHGEITELTIPQWAARKSEEVVA
jgi:hypothetical protein